MIRFIPLEMNRNNDLLIRFISFIFKRIRIEILWNSLPSIAIDSNRNKFVVSHSRG